MKKLPRETDQLNTEPVRDFTLEAIMAEYGSGAEEQRQTEPEAPETPPAPPKREEKPKPAEARRESLPSRMGAALKKQAPRGLLRTVRLKTPQLVRKAASPAKEPEGEDTVRIWTPRERPKQKPLLSAEQKEAPVAFHRPHVLPSGQAGAPTPRQELRGLVDGAGKARLLCILLWAVTGLTAAGALVLSIPALTLGERIPATLRNLIFLVLFLAQTALSLPVLVQGVRALLHGKYTHGFMALLAALAAVICTLRELSSPGIPLCVPAGFVLAVTSWGQWLGRYGRIRSLAAIAAMKEPMAAVKKTKHWQERDCVLRTPADLRHAATQSRSPSAADRAGSILAAVMTALSLVSAAVLAYGGHRDFLGAVTRLLLASCPLGCCIAYSRGFLRLTMRLERCGAAVAGWDGAKRLCGRSAVLLTDRDLYPGNYLRLNGVKSFSHCSAEELLGYAAALLRHMDTPVGTVMQQSMSSHSSRFAVESFTVYSAGLGGTVRGRVLLLGGLEFMRRMSVTLPELARPSGALYLSIDGEAAGMFVLRYEPSPEVDAGLVSLSASSGLELLLATRDLLIDPNMLHRSFRVSADAFLFPESQIRIRLSYPPEGSGMVPGAYLGKEGFLPFASAVAGSRRLCKSTRLAAVLSGCASVFGFLIMSLLCLLGAEGAASPLNLLLYQMVWLVPQWLITGLLGK